MSALSLPVLTTEDPEVAGEGSLDPLGLGAIGDRLGEQLLPGITNRMRRPRFLTAMTVGAVASDGLEETVQPVDGRSIPSTCFEWLVLESFERRRGSLSSSDLEGVAGSAKVAAAVAKNERLTASNYLKTASVFGFTGILMPLARSIGLLDRERLPAEHALDLVRVWEREQGFDGFADNQVGSAGAALRRKLRGSVADSLSSGRCSVSANSHLLGEVAGSLRPTGAAVGERAWLVQALLDPADEVRAEIGRSLLGLPNDLTDSELLELLRPHATAAVRLRLDVVVAYEAVATRLEAVLDAWRYLSTLRGTTPVTAADVATTASCQGVAATLAESIRHARESFEPVGASLCIEFDALVERFEQTTSAGDVASAVLEHHEAIQARKAPHGKRPWFESAGDGYVVRNLYRLETPPSETFMHFNRLYRLAALRRLLGDLV